MQQLSPSQPKLFLSDAHLGGFSEDKNCEIEQKLINLIDYCQEKRIEIFILGDLFDYWMEYPDHTPGVGQKLRERFEEYNSEFGPTLYITGNHDNWTRSYFESIGFELEPDYRKLEINGRQLLLLHGDGLINEYGQVNRPLMHRLLRNKTFIKSYQRVLPVQLGLKVMKWFSKANRIFGRLKEDITPLDEWAETTLRNTETEVIICGHDHFPRKIKYHYGSYLNLGTFYKDKTVVLYNNDNFDLVVWNNRSRELEPFYTSE